MIDDRQQELATFYSLDLLEGDEKARFEQEMAQSPELRRFVTDLQETSAHLADAAPKVELPAGLKERILRDAPHRAEVVKFPRNIWVPWSVAAAVVLMAALVGQTFVKAKRENEQLRVQSQQLARSETEARARVKQLEGEAVALLSQLQESKKFAEIAAAAEADRGRLQNELLALKERDLLSQLKINQLASIAEQSANSLAVTVWDPMRKEGVFAAFKLPPKAADQDFQLWVIDPAYAAPVSGGLIVADETGAVKTSFKADKPINDAAGFAISVEPKGGSVSARGPIILLGK